MSPSNSVDVFNRIARSSSPLAANPAPAGGTPKKESAPKETTTKNTVWYLLDPKLCQFEFREKAGEPYQRTDEIRGKFKAVWLEWFEGSTVGRGKAPCYCACIYIITESGEPILAKVSAAVPYYILAAKLQSVRKDDFITVRSNPVGDSCCFDIFIQDGDRVRLPARTQVQGDTPEAKVQQGTDRFYAHPNYAPKQEIPGPDGGVRSYRARLRVVDGGTPTPEPASQPPAPEPEKPVRQTNAQIPPSTAQPTRSGIVILGFDRYMRSLGPTNRDVEEFIRICIQKRVRASHMAARCQMAKCDTPEAALNFAARQEAVAA